MTPPEFYTKLTKDAKINWRHLVFKIINYAIITVWTVVNIAGMCPDTSNGGPFRYFRDEFLYERQCPMSPPATFANVMIYTTVQMICDLAIYALFEVWVNHQK